MDVEAAVFQTLPLPLPLTKNEKTTVDNFLKLLWLCSLPSPTLHHFEKTKTFIYFSYFISSLEHIVLNYSVFVFKISKHVLNVEQCFSIFFVIAEPLMYFRVCRGTPTNKNLEITNCLQENQILCYYNSKNN